MVSLVFPQGGADGSNFMSGNKLKLSFFNDGIIKSSSELIAEWPIGTGHEYLDFASPVLIIGSGGNMQLVEFTPSSNYTSYSDGRVAMNHLPESWPSSWPDRPSNWNGSWNGFYGIDQFNADRESLFSLENNALGLRLKIRIWQWSHYLAQDMVYLYYELENIAGNSFDEAAVGFFARPAVGGETQDDDLNFQSDRSQVISVDTDNRGIGRGGPRVIGDWSPVGRFGVSMLETPDNANDGMDNDGDGLIDESRTDGIDNDGDWIAYLDADSSGSWDPGEPLNDDVGEDGIPGSADPGEADGIPTLGEPNFDLSDVDESDQIGLTSLAAFDVGAFDVTNFNAVSAALTVNRFDSPSGKKEYVLGSGNFTLPPGEIQRFSLVMFVSANELDQTRNEEIIDWIYEDSYRFPVAPPPPKVTAVAKDQTVTLYWDSRSEQVADFEGYKIYRSTDPGFNDAYTVTDDKGILIYSDPVATFDLNNTIEDFFPEHSFGFRYYRGKNSGLTHKWTDTNVLNGKKYYYAVVAFNRGARDLNGLKHQYPTESTKSIEVNSNGQIFTDVNTVAVTPTVESLGYENAEYVLQHSEGLSTAEVSLEVIDRTLIKDAVYEVSFDTTGGFTSYSLRDVTDLQNPISIFRGSTNFSTQAVLNDSDPIINGLRVYLVDDVLKWDSVQTVWKEGNSNWSLRLELNNNLGDAIPVAADYEVRFGELGIDTAIFTTPIPVPFQVWNITDDVKENILILDQPPQNGQWDSGELIYIVEGEIIQNFKPVYWAINITAPEDSTIQSIAPLAGDVAFFPTRKPFNVNDKYTITANAASVQANLNANELDKVKVVPNPYIVSSGFEQSFLFTGGEIERSIQFIHLPQKCTIRIFNLRGVLIDVIEHESAIDNGSEYWDLLSSRNGKTVAYGIYIYHLDAPGIGERIGRFAIIR
jgi:hypothetical protein